MALISLSWQIYLTYSKLGDFHCQLDTLVLFSGSFILFFSFFVSKQILAAIISVEGATVIVIMQLISLREANGSYWVVFLLCAVATVGAAAGLRFVVKIIKFNSLGYVL